METTYIDIPTNFIKGKNPNLLTNSFLTSSEFHQFPIPVMQIPLFEKQLLEKDAQKKLEAQKLLKLKLKTLSTVSPRVQKLPNKLFNPDRKLEDGLIGTSYGGFNRDQQDLKRRAFSKPLLNTMFGDEAVRQVFTPSINNQRHINLENISANMSANQSPKNFMIKPMFTHNVRPSPPEHPKQSETNFLETAPDADMEDEGKRSGYIREALSTSPNFSLSKSTPVVIPLKTFGSSRVFDQKKKLYTQDSAKSSQHSPHSQHLRKIVSPKNRNFQKNSMLKALGGPEFVPKPSPKFLQTESSVVHKLPEVKVEPHVKTILSRHPSFVNLTPMQEYFENNLNLPSKKFEKPSLNFLSPQASLMNIKSSPMRPVQESGYFDKPGFIPTMKRASTDLRFGMISPINSVKKTRKSPNKMDAIPQAKKEQQLKTATGPINPVFPPNSQIEIKHEPIVNQVPTTRSGVIKVTSKIARVRMKLVQSLNTLKKLKLTPREILDFPKIFSIKPYEKKESKKFIMAAKLGKLATIEAMLTDAPKYLIYEFDHIHQTALHWAAKKGYTRIAKLLIDLGANVDAKDIIGRTPLFLAIQNDHVEIYKMLMANHACLWSGEGSSYKDLSKTNKPAWFYLSKMRKLEITERLSPVGMRESIWQREAAEILRREYVENSSREDDED